MIYVSLQSWYWFKYKIHSAAIMGKSTAAPKKAVKPRVTGKAKAKAKAASQPSGVERKPMRFLGQKFPSSSLP